MRSILAALLLSLAAPSLAAQGASRGVRLLPSGDWVKAKAEFSVAVQRYDREALAHCYLGRLALIDGDLETAAGQLERAVELDDNVSDYHLWYGKAIGQQDQAIQRFRAAR